MHLHVQIPLYIRAFLLEATGRIRHVSTDFKAPSRKIGLWAALTNFQNKVAQGVGLQFEGTLLPYSTRGPGTELLSATGARRL